MNPGTVYRPMTNLERTVLTAVRMMRDDGAVTPEAVRKTLRLVVKGASCAA